MVVLLEFASRVYNNVFCVFSSLLQVVSIERTCYSSLCKINLSEQALSAILVKTAFCALHWQELYSLLKCHYDIIVYVSLMHLVLFVVCTAFDHASIVVHDRYITECSYKIEVSHCLPEETFAHSLVLYSL